MSPSHTIHSSAWSPWQLCLTRRPCSPPEPPSPCTCPCWPPARPGSSPWCRGRPCYCCRCLLALPAGRWLYSDGVGSCWNLLLYSWKSPEPVVACCQLQLTVKFCPRQSKVVLVSALAQNFLRITSSSWCHVGAWELGWVGWGVTEYGRWLLGSTLSPIPFLIVTFPTQLGLFCTLHATHDSIDYSNPQLETLAPWPISSSYQKSRILLCNACDIVTEVFITLISQSRNFVLPFSD